MHVFALTLGHRQGLLSAIDRDRGGGSIPVPTADRRAWRVHAQDLLRVDADHWQGASCLQTLSLLYYPMLVWPSWPFLVSFHYSYKRIKSQNNWIILHMYHIFSIPTVFEVSFFVLVKVLNFQRSRLSVHILYVYCFASLSTCYFLKPIALASVWLTECIHHHMTFWGIGHSQTSLSLAEFTVLINMWFSKA